MSTTVGNGLTVDGTVKASQATQAGEAVVLGDDGLIPANLVASGGGKVITEYTSIGALDSAYDNGEIPLFSDVYLYAEDSSTGKLSTVYARCTGTLPWPILSSIVYVTASTAFFSRIVAVSGLYGSYVRFSLASQTASYGSETVDFTNSNITFTKAIVISEGS